MTLTDWLAIFGALAWTPPIFTLLKNLFTRPVVRVITNRSVELGYTTLGHIFNVRLAFSVKNHDIVVSGLKIRVIHESSEEKIFEWQGIKQQALKMTAPDGSILPFEKENSVLAIKLNQKDIEERTIQCQEISFIRGKQDYESKALKKMIYLKDQGEFDEKDFLKSQEMVELYNFIKHSFSWKPGKYEAIIELESSEKFSLIDNKYEFSLNSIDIEELNKNKNQIEISYGKKVTDESGDEVKAAWNWRSPTLNKI